MKINHDKKKGVVFSKGPFKSRDTPTSQSCRMFGPPLHGNRTGNSHEEEMQQPCHGHERLPGEKKEGSKEKL